MIVEVVQYQNFRAPNWYAKWTTEDGKVRHGEPWNTAWAAGHEALLDMQKRALVSRRSGGIGDGDECPLFPTHGNMFVLVGSNPPIQWCPHSEHLSTMRKDAPPPSRDRWPLHGFEDAVATYMARLDNAIRQADLPDLSDLEVK